MSDAYQKVHPGGYVPALVHDGSLVTESTDIIAYIDREFTGASLQASGELDCDLMHSWLRAANENQWCLKLLTYELIFKSRGHFSKPAEIEYYLLHQKNPELVQFMKDFSCGIPLARLERNIAEAYAFLARLDTALTDSEYLAGDRFSLADIATIVNVHRYRLCELDLGRFPALIRWYALVEKRPAFARAIVQWELQP